MCHNDRTPVDRRPTDWCWIGIANDFNPPPQRARFRSICAISYFVINLFTAVKFTQKFYLVNLLKVRSQMNWIRRFSFDATLYGVLWNSCNWEFTHVIENVCAMSVCQLVHTYIHTLGSNGYVQCVFKVVTHAYRVITSNNMCLLFCFSYNSFSPIHSGEQLKQQFLMCQRNHHHFYAELLRKKAALWIMPYTTSIFSLCNHCVRVFIFIVLFSY